jgi:hypothetical protein
MFIGYIQAAVIFIQIKCFSILFANESIAEYLGDMKHIKDFASWRLV